MPAYQPARPAARPAYHHGDLKRSLVEAALALVTEEQDWSFSLRAVARRAGVSHNAPYNHFADKRDLLAAMAAAGFDALQARLAAAAAEAGAPDAVLIATGAAYIRFGAANPARYRLMFGPTLVRAECLPEEVAAAAMAAKAVLGETIRRGAREGLFTASPDNQAALDLAILSAWATVHGLTMLIIDGMAGDALSSIPEQVAGTLLDGIRKRCVSAAPALPPSARA